MTRRCRGAFPGVGGAAARPGSGGGASKAVGSRARPVARGAGSRRPAGQESAPTRRPGLGPEELVAHEDPGCEDPPGRPAEPRAAQAAASCTPRPGPDTGSSGGAGGASTEARVSSIWRRNWASMGAAPLMRTDPYQPTRRGASGQPDAILIP